MRPRRGDRHGFPRLHARRAVPRRRAPLRRLLRRASRMPASCSTPTARSRPASAISTTRSAAISASTSRSASAAPYWPRRLQTDDFYIASEKLIADRRCLSFEIELMPLERDGVACALPFAERLAQALREPDKACFDANVPTVIGQSVNRDSRVILGNTKDRFGLRRARARLAPRRYRPRDAADRRRGDGPRAGAPRRRTPAPRALGDGRRERRADHRASRAAPRTTCARRA